MGSVTHCLGSQLALCLQLFVYMKALIAFKSVSVCHLKTDKSVVTSVVTTLMANPECMTFVPFSKELDLMFIKKMLQNAWQCILLCSGGRFLVLGLCCGEVLRRPWSGVGITQGCRCCFWDLLMIFVPVFYTQNEEKGYSSPCSLSVW